MNKVAWSATALGQLQVIRTYIGQFNPMAAQTLAEALIEAGNSLVNFPHRGRRMPGTDGREMVAFYPYIIRYRIVGDEIRILRVRHGMRRGR